MACGASRRRQAVDRGGPRHRRPARRLRPMVVAEPRQHRQDRERRSVQLRADIGIQERMEARILQGKRLVASGRRRSCLAVPPLTSHGRAGRSGSPGRGSTIPRARRWTPTGPRASRSLRRTRADQPGAGNPQAPLQADRGPRRLGRQPAPLRTAGRMKPTPSCRGSSRQHLGAADASPVFMPPLVMVAADLTDLPLAAEAHWR